MDSTSLAMGIVGHSNFQLTIKLWVYIAIVCFRLESAVIAKLCKFLLDVISV